MAEKLIPLEDAQAIVLSHVNRTEVVEIPVWQAAGLPLAEDAVADIDISPFANSAMDGYAVRSADLAQGSGEAPVTLDVIGHEAAGHVFEGRDWRGETVRIMTVHRCPRCGCRCEIRGRRGARRRRQRGLTRELLGTG